MEDAREFLRLYDSQKNTEEETVQALSVLTPMFAKPTIETHREIVTLLGILRQYKNKTDHQIFKYTFRTCVKHVSAHVNMFYFEGFFNDVLELLKLHGQTDVFIAYHGCLALRSWLDEKSSVSFYHRECKERNVGRLIETVKGNPFKDHLLYDLNVPNQCCIGRCGNFFWYVCCCCFTN